MKMNDRPIFLLDGATGSELERAGVDVGMPLWSANAILEAPEVLKQVHISYLEAGAQAITANTFRTHERSLAKAGMGNRAEELTGRAVEIAMAARDEVNTDALVFGSVAPLEDCYSPELAPPPEICQREHKQMMRYLVNSGVDLVLIETMCRAHEAIAAAKVANSEWAISFCMQTTEVGVLLDGTFLKDIIVEFKNATFIGVNCYPATTLAKQIKHLRTIAPENMALSAYGNVGYADDDGGWVSTDAIEPERFAEYAMEWVKAGASIVGGCCGTTPKSISEVKCAI